MRAGNEEIPTQSTGVNWCYEGKGDCAGPVREHRMSGACKAGCKCDAIGKLKPS